MKKNCWEIMKCGREKGGDKAEELGVCPVAVCVECDGINDGKNGGRICWAIAHTFCNGDAQGTFIEKMMCCQKCEVYLMIKEEEKEKFKEHKPGQAVVRGK